jgi:hypothetical protein
VFLTFLSLIVNQYVPVWMKDSEAGHMNNALGQFAEFKSSVDLQMLSIRAAQENRRHHVPIPAYNPITLGVDGVPIFTSPTFGTLESVPEEAPWSVEFFKDVAGSSYKVSERAGGVIRLIVANRYFVPQDLIYENGGVIRAQADGQFVRVDPGFSVLVENQSVELGFVLISLFGASDITGTSTEGVHHKVIGDNQFDHTDITSAVYINSTTRYGIAWYGYFNSTFGRAYGVAPSDYDGGSCTSGTYRFCLGLLGSRISYVWVDNPFYRVEATWNQTSADYTFRILLRNDPNGTDPDVPALEVFSLEHGFANTAVGSLNSGAI